MIKLVAFDWNGTLFADTIAIFESNSEAFKLLNLKPASFSTFQKYFDVPVKKYFLSLGASEKEINQKASQITSTFHAQYEPRAAKVRTRAFAKYLLQWLSKNNIEAVIFSNHVIEQIQKQLKRLKIEPYFATILANTRIDSALKDRSKKYKLESYIKDNHILASETLVVGDTVEEIEIGQKLGCITVAITHGNCSTSRLKNAKPYYLIHSLKEITNIINKS